MIVYRPYLGWYQELVVSDKFYEAIHQDIMAREGRPPVYSCGEGSDASHAACIFLAVRLTPVPRCETLRTLEHTVCPFVSLAGAEFVEIRRKITYFYKSYIGGILIPRFVKSQ
jgi:hypothetical protein